MPPLPAGMGMPPLPGATPAAATWNAPPAFNAGAAPGFMGMMPGMMPGYPQPQFAPQQMPSMYGMAPQAFQMPAGFVPFNYAAEIDTPVAMLSDEQLSGLEGTERSKVITRIEYVIPFLPLFIQNGAKNGDLKNVFAPKHRRCWVQNTSRITEYIYLKSHLIYDCGFTGTCVASVASSTP